MKTFSGVPSGAVGTWDSSFCSRGLAVLDPDRRHSRFHDIPLYLRAKTIRYVAGMSTARAAVFTGPRAFEMRELPLPDIAVDEALLRVETCGLCGSDLDCWEGSYGIPFAYIPGHEPVGIIEQIGELAAQRWGVRVGDRIAVEPASPCGTCQRCLGGRYLLCKNDVRDARGARHRHRVGPARRLRDAHAPGAADPGAPDRRRPPARARVVVQRPRRRLRLGLRRGRGGRRGHGAGARCRAARPGQRRRRPHRRGVDGDRHGPRCRSTSSTWPSSSAPTTRCPPTATWSRP